MVGTEEIRKDFEKYNNFKEYSDIAKYFLLNDDNFHYIHKLIGLMEFDDIESVSFSIKLVINLLKDYNINLFNSSIGTVYKLKEIVKDAKEGEIPEIELKILADNVKLLKDDVYIFNKENINKMIYDALKDDEYAEIKNATEKEIYSTARVRSSRRIENYSIINDLVIGRGHILYEFPVQLVIHRIYKQDDELYFHGKVHILKEIAKKSIFRIKQL